MTGAKEPPEEKSIRKRLNKDQKRALCVADIRRFVQQYGRVRQRGIEPNDRNYDREIEKIVLSMSVEELDRLTRDEEE